LVSWKGGAALLAVLVALAVIAFVTRPQGAPPAKEFIPCDSLNAVGLTLESGGKTVVAERPTPTDDWRLQQPVQEAADHTELSSLLSAISSIDPLNTIPNPAEPASYGLDAPHAVVTCRVKDGGSYTLSVGKASFDGSGYYARKAGDARVYVISSVPVDQVDRDVSAPPVQATPSAAGASPSPSS
jgi:hypothetical protein